MSAEQHGSATDVRFSRYRALMEAERVVREDRWAATEWLRLWLVDGELKERSQTDDNPDSED